MKDSIYYRDNHLFRLVKIYDTHIIMSGGSMYYDDAKTNCVRILVIKDELVNFKKVEPDMLSTYDFLYQQHVYGYRVIHSDDLSIYGLRTYNEPWIIDHSYDEKELEKKYNLLRGLKLNRILK